MKILTIFGTRPEGIKMAPVVRELEKNSDRVELVVCVTAQHRHMLDQVLNIFHIRPDIDLDLMENDQSPASLTARAMTALTEVLERVRPDLVLVQGDTTTAMVAALAAFYQKIPVGHIEAGLRTHNRYSPFPEEINRHLIGVLATYHFAPTRTAAQALRAEGIPDKNIFVTGNTVIDALLWVVRQPPSQQALGLFERLGLSSGAGLRVSDSGLNSTDNLRPATCNSKLILVTAHRRENFGQPFENICCALREIVQRNPDVQIVYPVHMNPNVCEPVQRILSGHERVHLIEPLSYEPFVHLMKHAYLILTDSGGIQEEAPALGKPVLVMRRETERPEAVEAGTVKIIGTDTDHIIAETERFLYDRTEYNQMAHAVSPYGDGHAAERIVDIILSQSSSVREHTIAVPKVKEPLLKRPLDVILSTFMLILSAPISLLIALAIKLEDSGPIFYRQKRWGRGGARFNVYKFRTMMRDADSEYGFKQASENDHRVTQVGRILRATGLDELPQLLNIWRGEMSFVGPRALAIEEIVYDENGNALRYEAIPGFHERHSVRPGLTGITTVYRAKDIHPQEKFQYDLQYVRNQSFWLDLRLIALSFWISFRGKWETRGKKV